MTQNTQRFSSVPEVCSGCIKRPLGFQSGSENMNLSSWFRAAWLGRVCSVGVVCPEVEYAIA